MAYIGILCIFANLWGLLISAGIVDWAPKSFHVDEMSAGGRLICGLVFFIGSATAFLYGALIDSPGLLVEPSSLSIIVIISLLIFLFGLYLLSLQDDVNQAVKETANKYTLETLEKKNLEELIFTANELKQNWEKYKAKSSKILSTAPRLYYQEESLKDARLSLVKGCIETKYQDVITTRDKLLEKAHSLASSSEEKEILALEKEMKAKGRSFASAYGGGYQYLENTHSSVLRGVVADKVAGLIAGGLVYATTEAKNEQIRADNISRRVHNAVLDDSYDELKRLQKQLEDYCISVVKGHNPDATIYLF